jgi:hypothetical protein
LSFGSLSLQDNKESKENSTTNFFIEFFDRVMYHQT